MSIRLGPERFEVDHNNSVAFTKRLRCATFVASAGVAASRLGEDDQGREAAITGHFGLSPASTSAMDKPATGSEVSWQAYRV